MNGDIEGLVRLLSQQEQINAYILRAIADLCVGRESLYTIQICNRIWQIQVKLDTREIVLSPLDH